MREATGELNMTIVTIVMIGVIAAFFALFWPTIRDSIQNTWNDNATSQDELIKDPMAG